MSVSLAALTFVYIKGAGFRVNTRGFPGLKTKQSSWSHGVCIISAF